MHAKFITRKVLRKKCLKKTRNPIYAVSVFFFTSTRACYALKHSAISGKTRKRTLFIYTGKTALGFRTKTKMNPKTDGIRARKK